MSNDKQAVSDPNYCPACELPADSFQHCGSPNCAVRGYGPGDACKRRAQAPSQSAPQITQAIRSLIEWAYDQGSRFGDEITAEVWFYEAEEAGSISKRLPDIAALARAPLPAQQVQAVDVARDAARLEWLQEQNATLDSGTWMVSFRDFVDGDDVENHWVGSDLRAAIDAAKSRTNTTGGSEE